MFRRKSNTVPKDPVFPADLKELGYFINDKDQIRSIDNPADEFNFKISRNSRVNDVQREAMNTCIRENLHSRFLASDMKITRLPLSASPTEPHVPILTSNSLSSAKRIIVYFGEDNQDLGVFAYRLIGQKSIAAGSALNLVHAAQAGKDAPAIVLANLGQLLWYRRGQKAVTHRSWLALPRATAVDGPLAMDAVRNKVKGQEKFIGHVRTVFEEVLGKLTDKNAEIDIIGLGEGAMTAVSYLSENWPARKDRVRAMCIGSGYLWPAYEEWDADFEEWFGRRSRAYLRSDEPLGSPLTGREDMRCNVYSAGEPLHTECIMPAAYPAMLKFFDLVTQVPNYAEVAMVEPEVDVEDGKGLDSGGEAGGAHVDEAGEETEEVGGSTTVEEVGEERGEPGEEVVDGGSKGALEA